MNGKNLFIALALIALAYLMLSGRDRGRPPAKEYVQTSENDNDSDTDVATDPAPPPKPPSNSPHTQPKPTPPPDPQKASALWVDIENSIRSDMYCADDGNYKLDPKMFRDTDDRRTRLLNALTQIRFGARGRQSVLNALVIRDREAALSYLENCAGMDCLFLKALILTDQLPMKGTPKPQDMRKGLSFLTQLKFMDRENGIYPYFALWPMQELHEKYSLKLTFHDFLRASRFENPLIKSYVALAQAGEFNATAHLYADELMGSIGVPNYAKATPIVMKLAEDSDFQTELGTWAKRRSADFDRVKEKDLASPAVLIVEMAELKSLARVFWQKSATPGPAPGVFGPDGFKEFLELHGQVQFQGSKLIEDERASPCVGQWELKREVHARYAEALEEMIQRWESLR